MKVTFEGASVLEIAEEAHDFLKSIDGRSVQGGYGPLPTTPATQASQGGYGPPPTTPATQASQGGYGPPPTTQVTDINTDTDTDSAGIKWDERIHARTKSKTADGKWKRKRNADTKLIAQIEKAQQTETIKTQTVETVEQLMRYISDLVQQQKTTFGAVMQRMQSQFGISSAKDFPSDQIPALVAEINQLVSST